MFSNDFLFHNKQNLKIMIFQTITKLKSSECSSLFFSIIHVTTQTALNICYMGKNSAIFFNFIINWLNILTCIL